MTEALAHGYSYLRVLSQNFPMNTNMTGFRCFSKIFASPCFGRKQPQHWEGSKAPLTGLCQNDMTKESWPYGVAAGMDRLDKVSPISEINMYNCLHQEILDNA